MTSLYIHARTIVIAAVLVLPGQRLFAQHDMSAMRDSAPRHEMAIGSGTSWIPRASSPPETTWLLNDWTLSAHGAAFGIFDRQATKRGDTQTGVIDWEMLMAMREVGSGMLELRAMTSAEPIILGGNGYAELLQTGGTYLGAPLHDRQHPHDALMELAAEYEHSLVRDLSLLVYAGAVGEPAAGPVAYMHRPSAANDPFAPIGHHWQDVSHQSFGVLTLGLRGYTLQLEGSAFNAREADDKHLLVDYQDAKLDSYSGRLSWAPSSGIVVSSWYAYLGAHERADTSTKMHRYGASVMLAQHLGASNTLSTTLIWGMNLHHHGGASHLLLHGGPDASPHHHSSSLLAESNLDFGSATSVFARIERVKKSGEEMGFQGGDLTELYDIRAVSGGLSRSIKSFNRADVALGFRGSVNFVPEILLATYGTRTPAGLAIFAELRPARH